VEEIGRLRRLLLHGARRIRLPKARLMPGAANAEVARQLAPAFDLFTGRFVA
jgi:hypothetical protein